MVTGYVFGGDPPGRELVAQVNHWLFKNGILIMMVSEIIPIYLGSSMSSPI